MRVKTTPRQTTVAVCTGMLALGLPAGPLTRAMAAVEPAEARLMTPTSTVMVSVFVGLMVFAIAVALLGVRRRERMTVEIEDLRARNAALRGQNDRLEAMTATGDQRTVVWDGPKGRADVVGTLPERTGAPGDRNAFLAFGRWLAPRSAAQIEEAIALLRRDARRFDLTLTTQAGTPLEAQGRVSGGEALVRFVELAGERAALAEARSRLSTLESEHAVLRDLCETMNVPIWLRDGEGRLAWVNAAYAAAVDCATPTEAVSRQVELLDAADRRELAARAGQENGVSTTVRAVVAGDRRTLAVVARAMGEKVAAVALDHTPIEAAQQALAQRIASHGETLERVPVALAQFDREQRLHFANGAFRRLFGLTQAQLESRPTQTQLFETLRADGTLPDSPQWRAWRDRQLEVYHSPSPREAEWILADGRRLQATAVPHGDGGATWQFEDNTETLRLRADNEAQLRIQSATLDHLRDAVAVFGLNGRLILCNRAFIEMWGFDPARPLTNEHIARIFDRLYPRLIDDGQLGALHAAITDFDERREDRQGLLEGVDGRVFDYRQVRLPEGRTMIAFADVTASVVHERSLAARNDTLESVAEMRNNFLGRVSRELRDPLNSISGFSEMLAIGMVGTLTPAQASYASHIVAQSRQLETVVDHLLNLTSIDAGALTVTPDDVAIAVVAQQVASGLRERLERRALVFDICLAEDAGTVRADPRLLTDILAHLIANAIAASPDGGVIAIESERLGEAIELAVTDQGPPIAAEDRDTAFAFFAGRTGQSRPGAAGLGLPIVHGLVKLHGGTVHVEDGYGERGARFVCRFPVESAAILDTPIAREA